jgi:hypothetical protein
MPFADCPDCKIKSWFDIGEVDIEEVRKTVERITEERRHENNFYCYINWIETITGEEKREETTKSVLNTFVFDSVNKPPDNNEFISFYENHDFYKCTRCKRSYPLPRSLRDDRISKALINAKDRLFSSV